MQPGAHALVTCGQVVVLGHNRNPILDWRVLKRPVRGWRNAVKIFDSLDLLNGFHAVDTRLTRQLEWVKKRLQQTPVGIADIAGIGVFCPDDRQGYQDVGKGGRRTR